MEGGGLLCFRDDDVAAAWSCRRCLEMTARLRRWQKPSDAIRARQASASCSGTATGCSGTTSFPIRAGAEACCPPMSESVAKGEEEDDEAGGGCGVAEAQRRLVPTSAEGAPPPPPRRRDEAAVHGKATEPDPALSREPERGRLMSGAPPPPYPLLASAPEWGDCTAHTLGTTVRRWGASDSSQATWGVASGMSLPLVSPSSTTAGRPPCRRPVDLLVDSREASEVRAASRADTVLSAENIVESERTRYWASIRKPVHPVPHPTKLHLCAQSSFHPYFKLNYIHNTSHPHLCTSARYSLPASSSSPSRSCRKASASTTPASRQNTMQRRTS